MGDVSYATDLPSPATGETTPPQRSLGQVFDIELRHKLEDARARLDTDYSLGELLRSNSPTAKKLQDHKYPPYQHQPPGARSLAAYFQKILIDTTFAEERYNQRRNGRIRMSIMNMTTIVEQSRQAALESNRNPATKHATAAHQRAELSKLNAAARTTILTTSRILTVAGELEHWGRGADDPTQPEERSLFELPVAHSRRRIINLANPETALVLALNARNRASH